MPTSRTSWRREAGRAFSYLDDLGVPWARRADGTIDQFLTDGSVYPRACYTGPYTANHIEAALVEHLRTDAGPRPGASRWPAELLLSDIGAGGRRRAGVGEDGQIGDHQRRRRGAGHGRRRTDLSRQRLPARLHRRRVCHGLSRRRRTGEPGVHPDRPLFRGDRPGLLRQHDARPATPGERPGREFLADYLPDTSPEERLAGPVCQRAPVGPSRSAIPRTRSISPWPVQWPPGDACTSTIPS